LCLICLTLIFFLLSLDGGNSSVIESRVLPGNLAAASRGQILQWLVEQGCSQQAFRLIMKLHLARLSGRARNITNADNFITQSRHALLAQLALSKFPTR